MSMCALEPYSKEINAVDKRTCVRLPSCFQQALLSFVSNLSSIRNALASLLTLYLLPLRRSHDECKQLSTVYLLLGL